MPSRTAPLSRWVCACLLLAACQGRNTPPAETAAPPPSAPAVPSAPAPPADPRPPRIVVLGDSLPAGLGIAQTQAYPALLQEKLDAAGYKWEVVNAGVSGDTSAAGLQRMDWALEQG